MSLGTVISGLLLWLAASAVATLVYIFACAVGHRDGYVDGYADAGEALRQQERRGAQAGHQQRRSA